MLTSNVLSINCWGRKCLILYTASSITTECLNSFDSILDYAGKLHLVTLEGSSVYGLNTSQHHMFSGATLFNLIYRYPMTKLHKGANPSKNADLSSNSIEKLHLIKKVCITMLSSPDVINKSEIHNQIKLINYIIVSKKAQNFNEHLIKLVAHLSVYRAFYYASVSILILYAFIISLNEKQVESLGVQSDFPIKNGAYFATSKFHKWCLTHFDKFEDIRMTH